MKRPTLTQIRALIAGAPALVLSFSGHEPREVPADKVATVTEGLITLSPLAIFFGESRIFWERHT